MKSEDIFPMAYVMEAADVAGNRLQAKKRILKRSEIRPVHARPQKEKGKIWIEDF